MSKTVRIGGASGFWGDAGLATGQLLGDQSIDFIVYDYLAEITMSIMARARAKRPQAGYASDFVTAAMAPNLSEIAKRGIKIISNAGGVNPRACAAALGELIDQNDLELKVAVIFGDDLIERRAEMAVAGHREMFSAAEFPPVDKIISANAYLGAFPIACALDQGADIVITGRCVDSAVTLGALIHRFAWRANDFDRLASGSLAGHIIECGPQATGGNFTDWQGVADTIEDIGYPIVEVASNGAFTVTKPADTGGKVSVGTVAEQMLYEIGDPQRYTLPDVECDFSNVSIKQTGENQVAISPASGRSRPQQLKVSATWLDGYRGGHLFSFVGMDAAKKAQRYCDATIERARRVLKQMNAPDFTETSVEILGADSQFGAAANVQAPREVVAKLAAKHVDERAIGLLLREATGLGLSAPPGLCGFAGTRPRPSPVVRLFSFLLPREQINVKIEIDGTRIAYQPPGELIAEPRHAAHSLVPEPVDASAATINVALIRLAWGRSGDKGDKANIGIIARDPAYLPWIWAALGEDIVAARFAHFLKGSVERFYLPGSHAINFLLHDVLGGGGVASIRNDPQGKAYAQILLSQPIPVPPEIFGKLS